MDAHPATNTEEFLKKNNQLKHKKMKKETIEKANEIIGNINSLEDESRECQLIIDISEKKGISSVYGNNGNYYSLPKRTDTQEEIQYAMGRIIMNISKQIKSLEKQLNDLKD